MAGTCASYEIKLTHKIPIKAPSHEYIKTVSEGAGVPTLGISEPRHLDK
jgi:hypothetical protein